MTDWAELSCVFQDDIISESEVEGALEDAEVFDPETVTENIWLELERRHTSAKGVHPIEVKQGRIERSLDWAHSRPYSFQLLLSCISHYKDDLSSVHMRRQQPAKLFERVTNVAMEEYLSGLALNIGFPRPSELPRGFDACLHHIAKHTGEACRPDWKVNASIKDANVDTVAWIPFGDSRPGQVVMLVQCATGSDWRTKTRDISRRDWMSFIDWNADLLKGFAFPFVCLDMDLWKHLSNEGGVLLDRLRISSLYSRRPVNQLDEEISQWVVVASKRVLDRIAS